jgi:SAM-dependent methyltransferase
MTHSLLRRANGQPVIGVDSFFFGLYVAKHWLAPEAAYVCCAADAALPFPDGACAAVFCSDAFHCFVHKATCMRELRRLTQPDGLILLVTMHNARVRQPHAGLPLPPEGYQALAADLPHRLVAASDVLARYLHKHGPALARAADPGHLADEMHLSLVASHRPEVLRDYGPFPDWPHAEGALGVNPLYVAEARDGCGNVQLRRTFPSAFYEAGHADCKQYLPAAVAVRAAVWADLAQGKRTPEMERLIEQCVVVGMPERYGGGRMRGRTEPAASGVCGLNATTVKREPPAGVGSG